MMFIPKVTKKRVAPTTKMVLYSMVPVGGHSLSAANAISALYTPQRDGWHGVSDDQQQ